MMEGQGGEMGKEIRNGEGTKQGDRERIDDGRSGSGMGREIRSGRERIVVLGRDEKTYKCQNFLIPSHADVRKPCSCLSIPFGIAKVGCH